ncbi:MAG TPA: glucosaminidase domain-containing protein [Dictyobacter sp.]|jgi:hypothetical protein|nr:glucosaminidase domain-containing protein [Dictyobacter sp.]
MPNEQRRTQKLTLNTPYHPYRENSITTISQQKTHRLPSMRKRTSAVPLLLLITIGALLCLCIAVPLATKLLSTFSNSTNVTTDATPRVITVKDKTYTLVGKPTISAAFINQVLAYYDSPASGKGQALYNDGVKYNIDPAYALAFFMEESNLGTQGVATVTHSLGNIRATPGHPAYDGYRKYATWEEGFTDWYRLIAQTYVQQKDLTTLKQIIPVYAPSTDNNNEQQYIRAVSFAVDCWRSGYVSLTS